MEQNVVVLLGLEPRIEESKSSVLPLHYKTIKKPYSIRLNRVCKVLTIRYRYQSVRLICCCWYCDVVLIILFINILFLRRDGRIRTCEFSCSQSRRGNRTPQHLVIYFSGPDGIRTRNLPADNGLSYHWTTRPFAVRTGFEPVTFAVTVRYCNQLY
jgi:hypothetical protein